MSRWSPAIRWPRHVSGDITVVYATSRRRDRDLSIVRRAHWADGGPVATEVRHKRDLPWWKRLGGLAGNTYPSDQLEHW